ncbi:MAG: hypothetical protein OXD50_15415 [Chloroflexi bacterium]|nr:hypothetical protein [Chloroflexota bacterium]
MNTAKTSGVNETIGTGVAAISRLSMAVGRRLKRPLLILASGIILLMLLIVVLQSGLGVDSDDTITDSHRPEIVGE